MDQQIHGMTPTGAVLTTLPLDNMVAEVHRLLGPSWVLPPYKNILPTFLKQPSNVQQVDLDYLVRKGALDVPEPQFVQEILNAYIRHVHPHIPFLDLNHFSAAIANCAPNSQKNTEEKALSPLLFQAVMFAGAFYVDLNHLFAAGYLSRHHALSSFFHRVRALYDFDTEDDDICVVQSLLLMTYWYESPEKHKDGRHWINVCISLACKNRLHLDDPDSLYPDFDFRKVLWWSIYARDRLIALGLQLPPVINDTAFSTTPALDFDRYNTTVPNTKIEFPTSHYRNSGESMTRIFVEKIKLCRCIKDDMFSWDCPPTKFVAFTKEPRRSKLWLTKLQLEDWLRELPDEISFCPKLFLPTGETSLLYYHAAWLKMVYLEIYNTLHRQLDFISEQYRPDLYLSVDAPHCPVLVGAIEFTTILQDLYQKNLISHLPTTSVAMILRTGIIHIQEVLSGDLYAENGSLINFLHCLLALQQLGRKYGSALLLAKLLGASYCDSIITSSPAEVLAHVDIDSLDELTQTESGAPTLLRIREPYDVDVVSGLKSRKSEITWYV